MVKLSILIPGVPTRFDKGVALFSKIQQMAENSGRKKEVEVIWFVDNWSRTLGDKRQRMLEACKGEYVVFCDDDDELTCNFLDEIFLPLSRSPDVVTFWEDCTWNETKGIIKYGLNHPYELMKIGGDTLRPAIHINVWKRELALKVKFKDVNWGEDKAWGEEICPLAKREIHIPKVLRIYNHQDSQSEALAAFKGER
jgi:glycosyltransferase involved in cell wall biosynthesis